MGLFKRKKLDTIDVLVYNYFQCIYYPTETDYGEGKDLVQGGELEVPQDIRVDEQDMLLIHSSFGIYNLYVIKPTYDFQYKCVTKINDIISDIEIDFDKLNAKLQQTAI